MHVGLSTTYFNDLAAKKIDTLLRSHDSIANTKRGQLAGLGFFEMLKMLYKEGLLEDMRCEGYTKLLEVVKQWGSLCGGGQ
ncbi:hypothetical protein BDW68DRAFT_149349 [Aspergillus falconensis]